MSTQKTLNTREWILVVVLLMLLQALIHFWSTETMSSSQIVNYISFAGTIVSIILAVLAIVYSFYQNFSQQNNVESISKEVENLKRTAIEVRESAQVISNTTDCLPKIMEDVTLLPQKINEAVDQLISDRTKVLLDTHGVDLKAYFKSEFDKSSRESGVSSIEESSHKGGTISYKVTYVINAMSAYRILYSDSYKEIHSLIKRCFGGDINKTNLFFNASNAQIASFISIGLVTFEDGRIYVNNHDFVMSNMVDYIHDAISSLESLDLDVEKLSFLSALKAFLLDKPYDMDSIVDRVAQIVRQ